MSNKDRRLYNLEKEKPSFAVLKMGIPVAMGMMFMVVYNLVDTFFIGLLNDDYMLAATNLAYPIMMVMVALSAVVASGASSYISRCMGSKDRYNSNKTLSIGILLIVIMSLTITLLGLVFLDDIINILGADESTYEYTRQYAMYLIIGTFFVMGNYTLGQLLRSEGSVMPSMIGLIAGTLANIILDPIFIFTLDYGVSGASIATVLGNLLGTLIFIYYYASARSILKPSIKLLSFDKKIIKEIFWVGLPHTLEQLMSSLAVVVLNNLAIIYGGLYVAAMGISTKLLSFGTYLYQGMTAGCQPLLGYSYGAKNWTRLKSVIKSGIIISTLIELLVMMIFGIFAPTLIGLFTESSEVIEIGVKTIRSLMLMLPFVSSTSIARNTYSAMGRPLESFVITFLRNIIFYIPFMIIFNNIWAYDGLIHAQPMTEFVCMFISIIMLNKSIKKLEIK